MQKLKYDKGLEQMLCTVAVVSAFYNNYLSVQAFFINQKLQKAAEASGSQTDFKKSQISYEIYLSIQRTIRLNFVHQTDEKIS